MELSLLKQQSYVYDDQLKAYIFPILSLNPFCSIINLRFWWEKTSILDNDIKIQGSKLKKGEELSIDLIFNEGQLHCWYL